MMPRHQHGSSLLLILMVILLAGSGLLLARLTSPGTAALNNDRSDFATLQQAKSALIAYAASHPTQPGSLPCPDLTGDGLADSSGSVCNAYLGRLPWKTLGLPALRDTSGECLWYAVSKNYRNVLSASSRSAGAGNQLNDDLPGEIALFNPLGAPFPASDSPAIAIVFAPGPTQAGQTRNSDPGTVCGDNRSSADYLERAQGIDNAALGSTIAAGNGQAILANTGDSFNDRAVWINSSQLFAAVIPRVLNTLRGSSDSSQGIVAAFGNHYPYAAASPKISQQAGLLTGWLPYADLPTYPTAIRRWLDNNGWPDRITYSVNAAQTSMTLGYHGKTLSCDGPLTCP